MARKLRLRQLVDEIRAEPIDPDNRILPLVHRERFLKLLDAMRPSGPFGYSQEQLAGMWGADLAAWFYRQIREPAEAKKALDI
jgi:hypothetical protein